MLDHDKYLKLLINLIKQPVPGEKGPVEEALKEIGKFIKKDFIDFSNDSSPSNNASLFNDFTYEFERLSSFVTFPAFANKNIVGIGGSFSSGKSSLLNSIFKRKILPAEIDPTTSIPTYIIKGPELDISAINLFERRIALTHEEFSLLTHKFTIEHEVSLSHIVKSIFIEMKEHDYVNLAFLDTPGYSKPDSEYYDVNTDESLARSQLNMCNFIVWTVDAEAGTIKMDDIRFISSLKRNENLLIIVSRADKKTPSDVLKIVDTVKISLANAGIKFLDVIPYSSRKPEAEQINRIDKVLRKWNSVKSKIMFTHNFYKIFKEYKDYYQRLYETEKMSLTKINLSLAELKDDQTELKNHLKEMKMSIAEKMKIPEECSKKLERMQKEFFSKLKRIGMTVNIIFPDVSEAELEMNKKPVQRIAINGNFQIKTGIYEVRSGFKGFVAGNKAEEGCYIEICISIVKTDKNKLGFMGKLVRKSGIGKIFYEGQDVATMPDGIGIFTAGTFLEGTARIYVRCSEACEDKISIINEETGELVECVELEWSQEFIPVGLTYEGINEKGFRRYHCVNDNSYKMIKIPASSFDRGNDGSNPSSVEVGMSTYYIGETPVTNAQFNKWRNISEAPALSGGWKWDIVEKNGTRASEYIDHPAVNITWNDAKNYSYWLMAGSNTGQNSQYIPSEAQYEKVLRGPKLDGLGNSCFEKTFVFGPEFIPNKCSCGKNTAGESIMRPLLKDGRGTTPVYNFEGQGYYFLYDICGNVFEWCRDYFIKEISDENDTSNEIIPGPDGNRCIRGGSWMSTNESDFMCSHRANYKPSNYHTTCGFRIVTEK